MTLAWIARALPALAWAVTIWFLSATPADGTTWLDARWLQLPLLDKVAHAGLFGLLAALLLYARATPRLAIGLAIVVGVVDEIHQAFVPGRVPDVWDLVADALGAVIAVVAVRWLASRRAAARYPQRSDRRSEP